MPSSIVKIISYNALSLLFLLLIVELSLKITQSEYVYYERSYSAKFSEKAIHRLDTNWVAIDPNLGWVCQQKKRLKFYRPDFFAIDYLINEQGFRNAINFENQDTTIQKKILLLGDSFMFGIFLSEQQTISSQTNQSLPTDYQIVNLAIPGWGIDQMYQSYEKYAPTIQPHQTLLFYIDDDIERTLEAFYWGASTKQAYRLDRNKLVQRTAYHGQLNTVEAWFVFNFQIVNRLYHFWCKQHAKKLSEAIFTQLFLAEQQAGRTLKVARFPRREQIGNNKKSPYPLTDFFTKNGVPFYDFNDTLQQLSPAAIDQLFIAKDGHLSASGATFVSRILKDRILSEIFSPL